MKITGKIIQQGTAFFAGKKKYLKGQLLPRIWILVGDEHLIRIYNKPNGTIELIGEAEPDNQENMHYVDHFTRDITNFLEHIETLDIFDRLIIIGTPKILDKLNTSFSKLVENKIIAEIHKDLSGFRDGDLKEELNKILWF